MQRICVTSGIFPPDIGGPATFTKEFTSWLSEQGINSNIVSFTDGKSYEFKDDLCCVSLISRRQLLPIRFLSTIRHLAKYSRNGIFLVNGLFLEIAILGMLRSINYITKIPGDIVWERARNQGETSLSVELYQGKESRKKKVMRFFFIQSLKNSRHVIVPNRTLKELVIKWGVDNSKISIVANGAKDIFFNNLGLIGKPKKYDLVTVGRLISIKRVEELLQIAKILNMSIAIVGSGPDEERLKGVGRKLQVDAYFLGELSSSEVVSTLNESKYFIMNSEHEGSPHALIEAMALGMVCLARSNSGSREILDGNNGLLYSDIGTLEWYLSTLNSNVDLSNKISLEAKRYADLHFRQNKIFEQILDLLK